MTDANEYKVKEIVTLEKFEVEEQGRRLVETIRIEDGVIVSVERPVLAEGG